METKECKCPDGVAHTKDTQCISEPTLREEFKNFNHCGSVTQIENWWIEKIKARDAALLEFIDSGIEKAESKIPKDGHYVPVTEIELAKISIASGQVNAFKRVASHIRHDL